jgi:hypothetical protein
MLVCSTIAMLSTSLLLFLIHLLLSLALTGVMFHLLSRHTVCLALLLFKLFCIVSCKLGIDFGTPRGFVAVHGGLGKPLDVRVAPAWFLWWDLLRSLVRASCGLQ